VEAAGYPAAGWATSRSQGKKAVALTEAFWRKYQHRVRLTEEQARECLRRPGDPGRPRAVGNGDRGGILLQIYELDLRLDAQKPSTDP
jgi:hypothetical protein